MLRINPARRFPAWRKLSACMLSATALTACGGGSGGGGADPAANNFNDNGGVPAPVQTSGISGKVSYDFVPTATGTDDNGESTARLDYDHIQRKPVRHALVEAVSEDGKTVLAQSTSDDRGTYVMSVPSGSRIYVRVTAQVSNGPDSAPDYLVVVRDNTAPSYAATPASAPLYSMRGDAITVGASGARVDLNAASGWTGSGYGAPRTAAPFAILDQILIAAQKMRVAVPDVSLPALNVYWSVDNRPAEGDASKGQISTSHYQADSGKGLYILGAENVDTDEYDSGVIVHEFGHYVEANLSRSDNVGGYHGLGDMLDMRVAFGEGYGNAFSSMMRDSPVYTDTNGPRQANTGVVMHLNTLEKGAQPYWFDESAVGNFLYSLYLSPNIGFTPIYRSLLNGEKTTDAFTSVFSFATALRPLLGDAGKSDLDTALAKINVPVGAQLDQWGTAAQPLAFGGTGQANAAVSPIYVPIAPNGTATSCATTQFGAGNKLGNYGHLRISIPAPGAYRLSLKSLPGGPAIKDYSARVYRSGQTVTAVPIADDSALYVFPAAGDYAADLLPRAFSQFETAAGAAPVCVSVSLKQGM